MIRMSTDLVIDGVVKMGFDYNLQIWVRDYICTDVGQGAEKCAGIDIRTIPEREDRRR